MHDIQDWLSKPEGKTLEFKRDLSSPDKVIRTIVAFANGAGGTVLIGVTDRTRQVVGVPDPTMAEEQLANLISDRIEPRLVPELRVVRWRRTHMLLVEVYPSSSRPHWVKAEGNPGGVYVRVGSTNRKADTAQVEELRRVVRGRTFDEEPLPELGVEALDFKVASECFAPYRKLALGSLKSLQLTTTHQRREVPTVGGVLLFGVERLKLFPEAFIRAGCFAGTDKSRILDSTEIVDHPVLAIEQAVAFVLRHTSRPVEMEGLRGRAVHELPLAALREAVINAVVHADYAQRGSPLRVAIFADRVEVENPGGLPPGLTLEDIHQGVSKLRNRVLGRVFHELELIEQWGSGIQRMVSACAESGLREPAFAEMGTGFRVTLWRGQRAEPKLDEANQRIVAFVGQNPGVTTGQIAAHLGITARSTRDRLSRLLSLGLLVAVGTSERDPRRGFFLAQGGTKAQNA